MFLDASSESHTPGVQGFINMLVKNNAGSQANDFRPGNRDDQAGRKNRENCVTKWVKDGSNSLYRSEEIPVGTQEYVTYQLVRQKVSCVGWPEGGCERE